MNLTYDIIEQLADGKVELEEWKPGHFRLWFKINGVQFNALTHFHYDKVYALDCHDWAKVLGAFAVANLQLPAADDENPDQI